MKVTVPDMAHNSIDNIFEYLSVYSVENAIQTVEKIYEYIYDLGEMPYLGKESSELPSQNFREFLYRRNKKNTYRILYFISKQTDTIYIVYVSNCRQNLNRILKLNNYFKDYFNF